MKSKTLVVALWLSACGTSADEASQPPAAPEPATEAPAPAPAPEQPAAEAPQALTEPLGHCVPGEVAVFSCPVRGGKIASVCASRADAGARWWLQYRFGPAGAPELSWPEPGSPPAIRYWEQSAMTSSTRALWFEREGHNYMAYDSDCFGRGSTDGICEGFVGVRVRKDDKDVAELPCVVPEGQQAHWEPELAAELAPAGDSPW